MAADVLDQFPDGVWLVELAPLADPALVPQAVAAVLGVREQPGRPLLDTLIDYLRPKTLLLMLDNCEHLIDGLRPAGRQRCCAPARGCEFSPAAAKRWAWPARRPTACRRWRCRIAHSHRPRTPGRM